MPLNKIDITNAERDVLIQIEKSTIDANIVEIFSSYFDFIKDPHNIEIMHPQAIAQYRKAYFNFGLPGVKVAAIKRLTDMFNNFGVTEFYINISQYQIPAILENIKEFIAMLAMSLEQTSIAAIKFSMKAEHTLNKNEIIFVMQEFIKNLPANTAVKHLDISQLNFNPLEEGLNIIFSRKFFRQLFLYLPTMYFYLMPQMMNTIHNVKHSVMSLKALIIWGAVLELTIQTFGALSARNDRKRLEELYEFIKNLQALNIEELILPVNLAALVPEVVARSAQSSLAEIKLSGANEQVNALTLHQKSAAQEFYWQKGIAMAQLPLPVELIKDIADMLTTNHILSSALNDGINDYEKVKAARTKAILPLHRNVASAQNQDNYTKNYTSKNKKRKL